MTVQSAPLSRSIRTVTISLSALQFQANVHRAVSDQADPLVTICQQSHEPSKIRLNKACSTCGNTDSDSWSKAQETGHVLIPLDGADLAAIRENDQRFQGEVSLSVVEADSTYLIPEGSSYSLAPSGHGSNYQLIAEVVRKRPKLAFIGQFSFRGAPHLFRLELVSGGVLVLREIARPEAIREQPYVPTVKVDSASLQLGVQLADALAKPFDPEVWVNPHAQEVAKLIEQTPAAMKTSGSAADTGDLLAQLQAAVAAAKAEKEAPVASPTPIRRRRAAKKAAAPEKTDTAAA